MHDFISKQHSPIAARRRSQEQDNPSDLNVGKIASVSNEAPTLLRRASCSCGGGCPACQANSGNLKISQPNEPAEIEADQIADRVMRMSIDDANPKSNLSNTPNAVHRKCSQREEEETIQRKPIPSAGGVASESPAHVQEAIASGGHALDLETRNFFELHLGYDLSSVRIHAGDTAKHSAKAVDAKAYTLGSNIVFGGGEYCPHSESGRHLLAHELVHVAQQRGMTGTTLQRQPATPEVPALIGASEILPFPVGTAVNINDVLSAVYKGYLVTQAADDFTAAGTPRAKADQAKVDWDKDILSETLKEAAVSASNEADAADERAEGTAQSVRVLGALDQQEAVVTESTDDAVKAALTGKFTTPAVGKYAEQTFEGGVLSLVRAKDGSFALSLTGRPVDKPDAGSEKIYRRAKLTAQRDAEGRVVLSSMDAEKNSVPQYRFGTGDKSGEIRADAFTAPFAGRVPDAVKSMLPDTIGFLQFTGLSADPKVKEKEKATVNEQTRTASAEKRQKVTTGFGGLHAVGSDNAFEAMFSASWQINFRPHTDPTVHTLAQYPLELSLQFTPSDAVIGAITSGFELSANPLIPLNLRIVTGLAGGQLTTDAGPHYPAFGPVFGAGVGFEYDDMRVDLRYDFLVNTLRAFEEFDGAPVGAHGLSLKVGPAF